MNILYLSLRLPYPPHRGDRIRAYNLLKWISQHHSVSLIAFHDDGDATEATEALGQFCERVILVPFRKRQAKLRCALHALSSQPLQLRYWYDSAMQRTVSQFLREQPCDLIHAHFFRMAQYVTSYPETPKLLDLCDALSLNLARRAALDRGLSWPLLKLEARRVEKHEIEIMRHFKAGTLVSEIDRQVLLERDPSLPLHVLPMGVDLDYYQRSSVQKRADILFTGTMSYFPNVDAALYFHREVMPRVRKAIPEARFVVAGSQPDPQLQQLADEPDFHLTGAVPDMRPYFSQASVFVSPMRAGSGMQTKNLEAMAMGLPVVTSPLGMEGLEAIPGHHLLLAESPEQCAERVVMLLREPEMAHTIGNRGRLLVEEEYSWDSIGEKLGHIYRQMTDA